jgi:hypothetical protein
MNGMENPVMAHMVTPSKLVEIAKFQVPRQKNMLVVGRPGIGKSQITRAIGEELNYRVLIRFPGNEEPTDSKGLPWTYMENGITVADFLPFKDLVEILTADSPLLVILDDFGQGTPAVQASYMSILLDRMIGGKPISEHVSFMLCTNARGDRANVSGVLLPVISRMLGGVYELIVDYKDWCLWALRKGLPQSLVGFVRWRESETESALLDPKPPKEIMGYFCPRTVAEVGLAQLENLPKDLELPVFSGLCGEAWARSYLAFLGIYRNLVMPEAIIANPMHAAIPDMSDKNGPATMFATCGALVKRVTEENFAAIILYAERLTGEFGQFLVDDCTIKNPKLMHTSEYKTWAIRNSHRNVGLN